MHRLLSIDDFLKAASEAIGVPEQELDTEPVLVAAKRALDRAGALRRKRGGPAAVYPSLESKAGAMVWSLLREPPLREHVGHVAYACLEALLAHNGARWAASVPMTILRFEQESRVPTTAEAIAQFVRQNISQERRQSPRRASGAQTYLFDQDDPPPLRVGVMLSNPFQSLTPGERASLADIADMDQPAAAR